MNYASNCATAALDLDEDNAYGTALIREYLETQGIFALETVDGEFPANQRYWNCVGKLQEILDLEAWFNVGVASGRFGGCAHLAPWVAVEHQALIEELDLSNVEAPAPHPGCLVSGPLLKLAKLFEAIELGVLLRQSKALGVPNAEA